MKYRRAGCSRPLAALAPIYLQRSRDRIDHRGCPGAAVDLRLARADLLDPVRAHRGHRPADQRGARASTVRPRSSRTACCASGGGSSARNGCFRSTPGGRSAACLCRRARPVARECADAVLRHLRGHQADDCGARYNFAQVCQQIGLRAHQHYCRHGRGPRIHDLRHTFAARTMIDWYRTGKDPAREMIRLTTYLGHADPDNTLLVYGSGPRIARSGDRHGSTSEGGEAGQ